MPAWYQAMLITFTFRKPSYSFWLSLLLRKCFHFPMFCFISIASFDKEKGANRLPADFLDSYMIGWRSRCRRCILIAKVQKIIGFSFAILEIRRTRTRTRTRARTRKQNEISSAVGFLVCYRQWWVYFLLTLISGSESSSHQIGLTGCRTFRQLFIPVIIQQFHTCSLPERIRESQILVITQCQSYSLNSRFEQRNKASIVFKLSLFRLRAVTTFDFVCWLFFLRNFFDR